MTDLYTRFGIVEQFNKATLQDRLDELETAIEAASEPGLLTVTAGENLAIRDVVYVSTGYNDETEGAAYKADASNTYQSSAGMVIGIATAAISSGSSGQIRIAGIVDGFTGLTAGALQYVSETAGELTETEPTNSWLVGIALSTTEMLINPRGEQTAIENAPPRYGYFAGGHDGSDRVATADQITFSSGVTAANTSSNLSAARNSLSGLSDGKIYGYFAGGSGSGGPPVTTADRIAFSSGVTAANASSNLSEARYGLAGLGDGVTYGYFAGGYNISTYTATADRITFSTGVTAANAPSDLSVARRYLAGISDGVTYGYFAGGFTGSPVATADRITFSTGVTAANAPSDLSVARYGLAGVSDGVTYGYFAGGHTTTFVATADRITFSTGVTAANASSDLSAARELLAGLSDGVTYGYFAGGQDYVPLATTDRITFSTGVTAANAPSDLSVARSALAGLSEFRA